MRFYAAWLGRFISVDPLQFEYPYYTPFQYAGNKPISFIDLDGAEPTKHLEINMKNLTTKLIIETDVYVVITEDWKKKRDGKLSWNQKIERATSSFDNTKTELNYVKSMLDFNFSVTKNDNTEFKYNMNFYHVKQGRYMNWKDFDKLTILKANESYSPLHRLKHANKRAPMFIF